MAQQTLNAGSPPIVWSTVEDAFTKINANFDELYGSIGGPGGVLDFTSLSTDIKPSSSEVFDFGSPTARWRNLYLAGSGLYVGSAQITADGAGILNLPLGATVNGELIINPSETAFKTITVSGQSNIVADSFEDALTVAGGTGITLTTNATTDTLTIANSGVTGLAGTVGQIGVSAATGSVTLTNLGVTSLAGTVGGIGVSAAAGSVTLTNLGVKQIVGTASQIGVTGDGTGIVTITNLAPASPTFRFIVVDGATLQPVSADNISDTLNLISGAGLTITKDTATDTLTFSVNSSLDIKGSVFGDDSSIIVDGTENKIYATGGFVGNLTGNVIGNVTGNIIGNITGDVKGSLFGDDSTAIINGIDNTVTGTTVTGGAVRLTGGTISTSDSSGIAVTVATTFNSDVTVQNELTVNGQVTIGSGLIIGGDLIINGTTTTINSVTLTVDDKNIELGSTASPTDVTADGGGITLKGSTDKTFTYVNSTGVWTSNIGVAATSFTGLAAAATTASTAASVGYIGIPQSATATTATLAISDAGKHIYVTTNTQTITIPANSVVPYPIGTAITFVAGPSATITTIANNDTMYLVGTGTSGSRTLAAYGTATAMKVASTVWFIAGTGLT
jgi:hypothetical protein